MRPMLKLQPSIIYAFIAAFSAIPALAQPAPISTLPATFKGTTAGVLSLSSIRNKDDRGNFCLGYGDHTADHEIKLEQDFPSLTFRVESNANIKLLLQETKTNKIYCGSQQITTQNLPAGTYNVWLGSENSGQQSRYKLIVE